MVSILIFTPNHAPLIYRYPIKLNYQMRPPYLILLFSFPLVTKLYCASLSNYDRRPSVNMVFWMGTKSLSQGLIMSIFYSSLAFSLFVCDHNIIQLLSIVSF